MGQGGLLSHGGLPMVGKTSNCSEILATGSVGVVALPILLESHPSQKPSVGCPPLSPCNYLSEQITGSPKNKSEKESEERVEEYLPPSWAVRTRALDKIPIYFTGELPSQKPAVGLPSWFKSLRLSPSVEKIRRGI